MKSISIKLLLIIISFALLVLTLTVIIGSTLFDNYYFDSITSKMVSEAKAISRLYYQGENQQDFIKEVDMLRSVLEEEIIVTSNTMLLAGCIPFEQASKDMLISAEERGQLVEGKTVIHKGYHPRFGKQILAVVEPLFRDERMIGAIFIYTPFALLQENIGDIQKLIFYGGIIAVIVAIFIGFFLSKRLSGPLIRMERVAREMANGNYEESLTEMGKDEIGRLSLSLNHLSATLAKHDKMHRDFVANVSHELRTPLSFLQGYSEILLDGVDDLKERKEYLSIILEETKRLRRLVGDLLELAKLESGQFLIAKIPLDWVKIVQRVLDNFRPIAQEKCINLSCEFPERLLVVCGNEDQLERVLINLLDNAHRFTPSGGKIEVSVKKNSDSVITQIMDTGQGIPEEDISMIWERFYKVDKSRTSKSGTGLGLAITKKIVLDHYGQIEMESEEGRGSTFTFTLPVCREIDCFKCNTSDHKRPEH